MNPRPDLFNPDPPPRPPPPELREYQWEAIEAVEAALVANQGNPCLVLPTGAGKTVVLAEMLRRWHGSKAGFRAVVLAHRKELLEQTVDKLLAGWPECPVGIVSAGLKSRQNSAPVCVAGIQSVARRPDLLGWRDLVVVDEAHRIPFTGEGQYLSVIAALRELNPALVVVGLTATPMRLDGGRICKPGAVLNVEAYRLPPAVLVGAGYLVPPDYEADPKMQTDVNGIKRVGGDFVASQLEQVELPRTAQVVAGALARLEFKRSILWFCTSVEHAQTVAKALAAAPGQGGARLVVGETPDDERRAALAAFRSGELRHLVNVDVLTEGFDAPNADAVVLMRATQSAARYVQMVGRGLRPAPGKKDCLVLDFGGNIFRHGFVDAVYIEDGAIRQPGEPDLVKACPRCFSVAERGAPVCLRCGFEWPPPPKRRTAEELLSTGGFSKKVDAWDATRYRSNAGNDLVMIEYYCGSNRFRDWLAVESPKAFARKKAWGRLREFGVPPPYPTTNEAVLAALTAAPLEPVAVKVEKKENSKFWEVVAVEFQPRD